MQIIDDNGFLALLDSSKYVSFLTEDWELDELMNHFVNQMNQNCFLIWRTNNEGGAEWNVDFLREASLKTSFREFNSMIEVTNGKLYLTEYTDLTMAASYPDEKIPSDHSSDTFFELANGRYEVTVRQLFDPEAEDEDLEDKTNFEIVLKPSSETSLNSFEKIKWLE